MTIACEGTAGRYDFPIKHGADFRAIFRFKDSDGNITDLTDRTVEFRAIYNGVEIIKDTADLVTNPVSGEAGLHITVAESRTVPLGRLMQYGLEVREPGPTPPGSGDQTVVLIGYLIRQAGCDNVD